MTCRVWSTASKSVPVRGCLDLSGLLSNVEMRHPDFHCSIHLALAALAQAGMLGLASGSPLQPPISKHPKEEVGTHTQPHSMSSFAHCSVHAC